MAASRQPIKPFFTAVCQNLQERWFVYVLQRHRLKGLEIFANAPGRWVG